MHMCIGVSLRDTSCVHITKTSMHRAFVHVWRWPDVPHSIAALELDRRAILMRQVTGSLA
jgi:hypothetical protein